MQRWEATRKDIPPWQLIIDYVTSMSRYNFTPTFMKGQKKMKGDSRKSHLKIIQFRCKVGLLPETHWPSAQEK